MLEIAELKGITLKHVCFIDPSPFSGSTAVSIAKPFRKMQSGMLHSGIWNGENTALHESSIVVFLRVL